MAPSQLRAAIYVRVSTIDQNCDNQLIELRRFATARGWSAEEYIDHGISGSKDRRPGLDTLMRDARRRRFDVVVIWKLDRLGRSLRHLLFLVEELQALGIALVSLGESIDATTPAGRLQFHVLSAVAQFERDRCKERILLGLQRARAQGVRLGRPRRRIDPERLSGVAGLPAREAARRLGVPRSTLQRMLAQKPLESAL